VVIKVEHGKVTHVEVSTRRSYEYKDLPAEEMTERRNVWRMALPPSRSRPAVEVAGPGEGGC